MWKLVSQDIVWRELDNGVQESRIVSLVPSDDPEYAAITQAAQEVLPVAVPEAVTPRQVRLLLLSQNLLSQVEALIAASDQATKITWQYASEFRRDDPLLAALSQQLGLTDEQVDQFFIAASQL